MAVRLTRSSVTAYLSSMSLRRSRTNAAKEDCDSTVPCSLSTSEMATARTSGDGTR